jgi:hypothetical protein
MFLTEEEKEAYEECWKEYCRSDPVHRDVRFSYFVSASKGRGRKRKEPKEVSLVSYRKGPFRSWHLFAFDVYATECLGYSTENTEEEFRRRILALR